MIILLEGYGGSGKSVLRGLLDGYPSFFVSPVHDKIVVAFSLDNKGPSFQDKWLETKDIEYLRYLLASKSQYYRIEQLAINKKINHDFSSRERSYFDFSFDFYKFDKLWVSRLLKEMKWTPEIIAETIYQAMFETLRQDSLVNSNIRAYVTNGFNKLNTPAYFLKYFPNGKLIYLHRSPEGIIATLSGRKTAPENFRTHNADKLTPMYFINGRVAEDILQKDEVIKNLVDKYPDHVMSVKFNELVENTEATMKSVASFLDIEFKESLSTFTFLGKEEVSSTGQKYVGKIMDKPEDLLSKEELFAIHSKKGNATSYLSSLFSSPVLTMKIIYKDIRWLIGRITRKVKKLAKRILR